MEPTKEHPPMKITARVTWITEMSPDDLRLILAALSENMTEEHRPRARELLKRLADLRAKELGNMITAAERYANRADGAPAAADPKLLDVVDDETIRGSVLPDPMAATGPGPGRDGSSRPTVLPRGGSGHNNTRRGS